MFKIVFTWTTVCTFGVHVNTVAVSVQASVCSSQAAAMIDSTLCVQLVGNINQPVQSI